MNDSSLCPKHYWIKKIRIPSGSLFPLWIYWDELEKPLNYHKIYRIHISEDEVSWSTWLKWGVESEIMAEYLDSFASRMIFFNIKSPIMSINSLQIVDDRKKWTCLYFHIAQCACYKNVPKFLKSFYYEKGKDGNISKCYKRSNAQYQGRN